MSEETVDNHAPGELSSTIARIIMPFVYKEQKLIEDKMQLWFTRPSNIVKIIVQKDDDKYYVYTYIGREITSPTFSTADLDIVCKYLTNIYIEYVEIVFNSDQINDLELSEHIQTMLKFVKTDEEKAIKLPFERSGKPCVVVRNTEPLSGTITEKLIEQINTTISKFLHRWDFFFDLE